MTLLLKINHISTLPFGPSLFNAVHRAYCTCTCIDALARQKIFQQVARRVGKALVLSRYRDRGLFAVRERKLDRPVGESAYVVGRLTFSQRRRV